MSYLWRIHQFTDLMTENIRESIARLIKKYHLDSLQEVGLFIFIIVVLHFAWRFWANTLNYRIAGIDLEPIGATNWLVNQVVIQSAWFDHHVLNIGFYLKDNKFAFDNSTFLMVGSSCSGLKQIYQFIGLMIFYPGPWLKKTWFIPLGAFVIHLTNLFRIIGLSVILQFIPQHWKWLHDWAFRPFFYVVIFSLWVWWAERLSKTGSRQ
ncbi:MAG: hypothetical protein NTW49_07050 [Bacteroidia bacterium]|nr:hypothetical protein [Bacteroidia bacterium]